MTSNNSGAFFRVGISSAKFANGLDEVVQAARLGKWTR